MIRLKSMLDAQVLFMLKRKHHGLITPTLIVTTALCAVSELYADSAPLNLSENYYYDDLPVVLSVSRLSQSQQDTPSAITVIDRKMIEASAALNIPDLLRLVPGFVVGFYSGTRATVTYHGHADEYARDMQVLIDGRSIYDPVYGGIPWTEISLSMDEILRIEVIRGPNAAAYGSNSYAGVINIVTNRPEDMPGTRISATIGYQQTRYVEAAHSARQGNLDFRISTSYREDGGFDNRDDTTEVKWLKWDSDYHIDENNSVRTTFGVVSGDYLEGHNTMLQNNRQLDTDYNYQSIEWSHLLNPNNTVRVHFYHNYYAIEDTTYLPTLSEQIMADSRLQDIPESMRLDAFAMSISDGRYDFSSLLDALHLRDEPFAFSWIGLKSHRYDLEVENTLEPMDELRLAWGIGARQDRGESTWLFQSEDAISRDLFRLFLNGEWYATQQTVVNMGAMLEKFEGKKRVISPRLGVNYHLNTTDTIRVSGSRAYRMPTIYEDKVNLALYLGSDEDPLKTWAYSGEDLDPQRIDRVELGYFGQFIDLGLNYDVCLFHERYTNIIDSYRNFDYLDSDRGITDPVDQAILYAWLDSIQRGAFTYTNFGVVEIDGIEFELDYRATQRDLLYFGFSYLNVHGNEIKRIKEGVTSYRDNAEVKIPKRTFSLLASHRFDEDVTLSAAYYFTDELEWPGEGDAVPNYSRFDVKVNKHIHLNQSKLDLSLIYQNLHNKNYDFYHDNKNNGHNVWEPRAYVQARLAF